MSRAPEGNQRRTKCRTEGGINRRKSDGWQFTNALFHVGAWQSSAVAWLGLAFQTTLLKVLIPCRKSPSPGEEGDITSRRCSPTAACAAGQWAHTVGNGSHPPHRTCCWRAPSPTTTATRIGHRVQGCRPRRCPGGRPMSASRIGPWSSSPPPPPPVECITSGLHLAVF